MWDAQWSQAAPTSDWWVPQSRTGMHNTRPGAKAINPCTTSRSMATSLMIAGGIWEGVSVRFSIHLQSRLGSFGMSAASRVNRHYGPKAPSSIERIGSSGLRIRRSSLWCSQPQRAAGFRWACETPRTPAARCAWQIPLRPLPPSTPPCPRGPRGRASSMPRNLGCANGVGRVVVAPSISGLESAPASRPKKAAPEVRAWRDHPLRRAWMRRYQVAWSSRSVILTFRCFRYTHQSRDAPSKPSPASFACLARTPNVHRGSTVSLWRAVTAAPDRLLTADESAGMPADTKI